MVAGPGRADVVGEPGDMEAVAGNLGQVDGRAQRGDAAGTAALPLSAILVSADNLAGTAVTSSFQASTSKAGGSSPSSQPLTA